MYITKLTTASQENTAGYSLTYEGPLYSVCMEAFYLLDKPLDEPLVEDGREK